MEKPAEVMYISEIRKNVKSKTNTSGNKVRFTVSTMNQLETRMRQNGATLNELMIFEKEFLEANGIVVPESFFTVGPELEEKMFNELENFISNNMERSKENIKGKDFYNAYEEWCIKNNKKHRLGKKDVFAYLRKSGMLSRIGTINGKTYSNVLKGIRLKGGVS